MQVKVNIYITAAGATRAFLLRDEEGSFPEVIGVGRTLHATVTDYADCFQSVQKHKPENERVSLLASDVLLSRHFVRRFSTIWNSSTNTKSNLKTHHHE